MRAGLVKARRTAAIAAAITLLLALTKAAIGYAAGSTALVADALHSGSDLLALAASWFGLSLAGRKPTQRFPYGFYRAETLAALLISGLVVYLGGALLWKGMAGLRTPIAVAHALPAMAAAGLSVGVALLLSRWETRVSASTGSQSLAVTAAETRMDAYSSVLVFVAVLMSRLGWPGVEGIATILISGVVIWTGLKNGRGALLALMDASVDPGLEREVASALSEIPGVRKVEKVSSRKAGPYFFVEAHVWVAGSMDVNRSHALSHEAQQLIKERQPKVEGVILHLEPYRSPRRRVLVPVQSADGLSAEVESHFGRAPWFLIAAVDGSGAIEIATERNPFADKAVRAGLAVINRFLKEHELDAILVREIGEIAFHGLRDNGVEVLHSRAGTAEGSLREYRAGGLEHLNAPTHSSEEKMEERPSERGLRGAIEEHLAEVIDPGAGLDVFRMGLVRDLEVSEGGDVSLVFRPSSPVCPMAFSLVPAIKEAIESVPGVGSVSMRIKNFNRAAELEALLAEEGTG